MCREYPNVAPGDTEQVCILATILIACDTGHSEQEVASCLDVITADLPATSKSLKWVLVKSLIALHIQFQEEWLIPWAEGVAGWYLCLEVLESKWRAFYLITKSADFRSFQLEEHTVNWPHPPSPLALDSLGTALGLVPVVPKDAFISAYNSLGQPHNLMTTGIVGEGNLLCESLQCSECRSFSVGITTPTTTIHIISFLCPVK